MRHMMIAALMLAVPAIATAQSYYDPPPKPGETRYTYDRQTGNRYRTTTEQDGSTRVQGSNYQTGARWKAETDAEGQTRGTNANGERWRYNPDTGVYRNSTTGETCRGTGARRTCY